MANFLLPLIRYGDRPHELRNTRTGRLVAEAVIPAFDSDARRKGLLGRDSFEKGSAIVIAPSNAIHTFFMQFSIDALFVRRDGVVVKIRRNIPPWRLVAALWAYAVIELPGGTLTGDDAQVGDVLTMVAATERVVEAPALARVS
ncbi:MAG TPA: DUF192 domain-containing protein [Vicinamibacterales bacterium]|nr:DUF192 domain-containing protein [Vicinamibacterales bacterium]